MNRVLLPSSSWPSLFYFTHLLNAEGGHIEYHDSFARQTYRNRYEILSANGILPLTVPLKKSRNNTRTAEIQITYNENWQQKHWRAITSAYRKSPFFDFFEDEVRAFYSGKTDLLVEYNMAQLRFILKKLREKIQVHSSTQYETKPDGLADLRHLAELKRTESWGEAEKTLATPYYQTFGDRYGFVPNLSILDLLFNEGLRARDYLHRNK